MSEVPVLGGHGACQKPNRKDTHLLKSRLAKSGTSQPA